MAFPLDPLSSKLQSWSWRPRGKSLSSSEIAFPNLAPSYPPALSTGQGLQQQTLLVLRFYYT